MASKIQQGKSDVIPSQLCIEKHGTTGGQDGHRL